MVKDAHKLLREWVPYHLLLGATHIYVVNNDCGEAALSYGGCDGLQPYVDAGVLTLLDPAFRCRRIGRATLLGTLTDELVRARPRAEDEWVLEVDPDEYLVLPPHARVPDLLAKHGRTFDSVPLPWRIFGTSFRANTTREGTVAANYRLRLPLALTLGTYVQLVERQKAKDQVHPFLFKEMVRLAALGNASRCRDAHGAHGHKCARTLDWVAERATASSAVAWSEEQAPMPAAAANAFIHHYTFLSAEDWARKKLRGRPRKGTKFARRQGEVDPLFSAVYDTTILDRLALLAEDAEKWSAHPSLARGCAASLQYSDDYFALPMAKPLAAAAAARAAARKDAAAGSQDASVRWLLERWAGSGHESRAPVAAARAVSLMVGLAVGGNSSSAATWLLSRWADDAKLRATAGEVTTRIVAAYPAECEADAAACAGWTTMDAERV